MIELELEYPILKGKKGDAFTYDDFTPEQLAALKGPRGDAFTYDDFTPEQLAALKGAKGDAFTFDDFTPEQLAALKGPRGDAYTITQEDYGNISDVVIQKIGYAEEVGF